MKNVTHETGSFAYFESFKTLKAVNRLPDEEKAKFRLNRLTSQLLYDFMNITDLDVTTICFIMGMSGREYRETYRHNAFTVDQSERIFTLAELYAYGYDIYNNKESFNYWMRSHKDFLGDIPPMSVVNTLAGVKEMITNLKALEHGVIL